MENINLRQILHLRNKKHDTFINKESYLNITDKNLVYLLGFIWADGNVCDNSCRVNFVYEDFLFIKNIFTNVGKWYYKTIQHINRKEQINISVCCIDFCDFLKENDYLIKSYVSADKILSKIPDNLKHYFFRGVVDGDGFIINQKE